jgi:hypothetical protein
MILSVEIRAHSLRVFALGRQCVHRFANVKRRVLPTANTEVGLGTAPDNSAIRSVEATKKKLCKSHQQFDLL